MNRQLRWMSVAGLALAGLALTGAAPADTQPVQIQAGDLTRGTFKIIGTLQKPLGTYMTIEGDYFGPPAMIKCGLYADAIDGTQRGMAVVIQVDERGLATRMEAGRRYRVRGFETGAYGGVPDDPQNPPAAAELRQRQKAEPYTLDFSTTFYVTKAEDLGPITGGKP